MSSNELQSVVVENISKCYRIYKRPSDRLKQMIFGRYHKYYTEFWALKNISFKLYPGQTLGVIGRNGSGKSTLLQIICSTLSQTSGTIYTRGRVAALLELGSGFNPEFTGRENVFLNASILGLSHQEIAERFDDIASFADIGSYIDQPVKMYSSGMYVRLAFSVIAHVNAEILVIDEALAVGDAFFMQKCMRFLREFQKHGTLLIVSHDTRTIASFCTRALWIEKGVILQDGNPKNICESYLEAFYESKQGKSTTAKFQRIEMISENKEIKDQRLDIVNRSKLRNDLQIFKFNLDGKSFGKGGAQIVDVSLLDAEENSLVWIVGGERVILRITAKIHHNMASPILGFFVKDRLGQAIFGDNTYLSYVDAPCGCHEGELLQAEFNFCMPILPEGTYSITVAVAEGTQEDHVQHHWIHDVLFFKSESSMVATGIVGIPMLSVKLGKISST